MLSVKTVMETITNPESILKSIGNIIRIIDPSFSKEEELYQETVAAMQIDIGDTVSPSVSEYIAAQEKALSEKLLYAIWLGFQQNLKCHLDPINANFLDMDYEDFLCERRMHMLPEVSKANDILNDFWAATRTLPEEKRYLSDGLLDYICHIESAGYKLAHFWGFALADQFLGHVIPGYCMDNVTTIRYEISLWNYFGCVFDVRN